MKRLRLGDRVVVSDKESLPELVGIAGKVVRIRIADNGAWVAMDALPEKFRRFHSDDEHGRGNHVILYPEQVEKEGAR